MSYTRCRVSALCESVDWREDDLRTESLDRARSRVLGRDSLGSLLLVTADGEPLRLIGGESEGGDPDGLTGLEFWRGDEVLLSGGNHFCLFVEVTGILTRT